MLVNLLVFLMSLLMGILINDLFFEFLSSEVDGYMFVFMLSLCLVFILMVSWLLVIILMLMLSLSVCLIVFVLLCFGGLNSGNSLMNFYGLLLFFLFFLGMVYIWM